jgi:hypothetical protein
LAIALLISQGQACASAGEVPNKLLQLVVTVMVMIICSAGLFYELESTQVLLEDAKDPTTEYDYNFHQVRGVGGPRHCCYGTRCLLYSTTRVYAYHMFNYHRMFLVHGGQMRLAGLIVQFLDHLPVLDVDMPLPAVHLLGSRDNIHSEQRREAAFCLTAWTTFELLG